MASEQPHNTPRIFDVQDPATNQHVVMVLMTTNLLPKYPSKPWGTSIADIGLSKKDAELFPGYVLVDFEPMKGSSDLFWIFQNLTTAPTWTTRTNSRDKLTPPKFRGQVSQTKVKQDVAPDTLPDAMTGDLVASTVEQQDNTGKAVKVTVTEVITENVSPLVGEEYGDIVTRSVFESLVVEGTAADTGIDVISSVVDPTGDGKAVRQTKRVKGGVWPNPLGREVSKENGNNPPSRYTKDLTRTKVSRKIAPAAIPSNPTLSGNEVGKSYKNETPDRAEEVITTQTLTLNTSSVDESREQKPFVSILSRMTPGTSSVLPTTGNGSSSLVYEAPDGSKIYENTAQIATARPGPAGTDKDVKPFVRIDTAKRYSTDNAVATGTGSANVIFNDGTVLIYEISEITSTGRYGPAGSEQQVKPFVKITSTKTYTSTGVMGSGETGSSNKIYDDGTTVVYEKSVETATARPGPAGVEKDSKPFVQITTDKRYSSTPTIATLTGSANVVFNDGATQVYEISEPAAVARPYTLLAGKDAKLGYSIEETDVYGTDPTLATKTGNVGVAFDDGSLRIYKKTEIRAHLNNVEFDSAAKNTKLFKETVHTSFKTSANGDDSKDWDASVAYSDGDLEVYRIDEVSITAKTPLVYYTAVNASMPSVLKSITIEPIERLPDSGGERRDKMCIKVVIEEGYSGLFKAKITEKYTEDPAEADSFSPLIFKPTRIDYDGLNYQVSIGETLHQQIVFVDTIGTGDPDYATGTSLSGDFRTFAATVEHASIPSGWQKHAIQVDPYKNGFLVKTIEIQYKA